VFLARLISIALTVIALVVSPVLRAQLINIELLGASLTAPVNDVLADINLLSGGNELLGVEVLGSSSLLGVSVSGQDILLLGAPVAGGGGGLGDLSSLTATIDNSQGAVLEFLQDTAMGDINPTVLTLSLPGSGGGQNRAEFDNSKDKKPVSSSDPLATTLYGKPGSCIDEDRDSVCDSHDQCLNSPAGAMVLPSGCHFDNTQGLALQGVTFAVGTADLVASSAATLQKAAQMLKLVPSVYIEVAGYTDDVGAAADNQLLSEKRALAVKQYLVAAGVPEKQLVAKGYGETQPMMSIDGLSGKSLSDARSRNRRVELRVLGERPSL
jgi:OOP family OmpA-OmpF porin